MYGGYWHNVGIAFFSNIGWFASSLYQCFVIPLVLSVLALNSLPKTAKEAALSLASAAGMGILGAALFALVSPLFPGTMAASVADHVLLLLLICIYAALGSRLDRSVRVVVASAMFMEINWAFAIAHLLFLPNSSLETANLLQLLVMLVGFGVVYIFRPAPTEKTPMVYWLTMLLIAVLSFVSLTVVRILESIHYYAGQDRLALAVLLPAFFVVSLLIYYLYYALTREHRQAEQMAAIQMKQSRDLEFYERTRALCSQLHAMRHELKNHIAVMEAMLRDQEYDKLSDYFCQVRGQNAAALEEFHCENPLIFSVVNNAISTARAAGVRMDVVAAVPETLPIGQADLCSILSNLLDNSIEGCLAAGGSQVRVSLHTEKGYLFITVGNPAPADLMARNPHLTTTKQDAAAHGFGIPIIRRLAEKYNGCVTFQAENGYFTADVMLCLEGDAL